MQPARLPLRIPTGTSVSSKSAIPSRSESVTSPSAELIARNAQLTYGKGVYLVVLQIRLYNSERMAMKKLSFTTVALAAALLGSTTCVAQYGPPPPGYYQGPGGWDAPPLEFREYGRLGFHDGIFGAQRDIENHRRPNVRNRDEFRHPAVPGWARDEYRQAFRRGYSVGIQHVLGGPYHQF